MTGSDDRVASPGDQPPRSLPGSLSSLAVPPEITAALDAAGRPELHEVRPGRWVGSSVVIDRVDPSDEIAGDQGERARSLTEQLAAASLPVGRVLAAVGGWTIAAQPKGQPADRPDRHADPDDLIVAVGEGLRRLHSIPLTALPAVGDRDGGRDVIADACRSAVAAPGFEAKALAPPYDRYTGPGLLAMALDGRPTIDQPVCCHGRPTLGQFIVEGGSFTGFDDLGSALAEDRHLDLAIIHQSVHHELGPEAVFRFYDSYGADPDLVRLDHYILVSHILGTSPIASEAAGPANS